MEDNGPKLDWCAKSYGTPLAEEESLICEALVREIGMAQRWSAVLDGFNALLHVRHMAAPMHLEARQFQEADDRQRPSVIDTPKGESK